LLASLGCGRLGFHAARAPDATGGDPDAAARDSAATGDACQPTQLLIGGTDVTAQGWSIDMIPPATVSYGSDYVRLATSTMSSTSGTLMLAYPGAPAGQPMRIEVVMLVVSVDTHNQYDSAATIMGSYSGGVGGPVERGQMLYIDNAAIGWADDTQSFAVTQGGVYHTYDLAVDATGTAQVSIDGTPALSRTGYMLGGAIGIGDQTNDPNVDSVLQVRSVKSLCP
jgi:hypothetical protein